LSEIRILRDGGRVSFPAITWSPATGSSGSRK
jgi:hypothetical protein